MMATKRPNIPAGSYGATQIVRLPSGTYYGSGYARDEKGLLSRVRVRSASQKRCHTKLISQLATATGWPCGKPNGESSFEQLALEWLAAAWRDSQTPWARMSPQTIDRHESTLRQSILPNLGHMRLNDITVTRLQTVIWRIAHADGLHRARKVRTTICHVLEFAVTIGATDHNLARNTILPLEQSVHTHLYKESI